MCEHLALHTLDMACIHAARTQIFSGAGRVFLESERFDRTPAQGPGGQNGRIGMMSLQVYDAEYVGEMDNWAATANRMVARKLLTALDARTLRLLEAYGQLIANTDRHYGNISLLIQDDDWVLSPTYDMLPMRYAPIGGELVARDFASQFLQPTAATLPEWAQAKTLTASFWHAVVNDARVSEGFRAIAAKNLHKIRL